jgi:hypothetical protein
MISCLFNCSARSQPVGFAPPALLLTILLLAGLSQAGQAQTRPDSAKTPARWGVNLQLGTTGPGLHVSRVISQRYRLSARVGVSYFAYNSLVRLAVSDGAYIQIQPDFVLGVAQGAVRWHPFRRGSFFLTAGAGYTWRPDLSFTVIAENTLDFGGLTITPENVGTIQTSFRWSNVVGYAGFGTGRLIPRPRIGFGFELGCYYLGPPSINLVYDGFLETTTIDQQIPRIQQNMSGYRYLPMLNLFVSYRIR